MKDNTSFFVGTGPDVHAVRDALAEIFGVRPEAILLAPAIGYEWREPEFYDGKTLLQWHWYLTGAAAMELEVLLGGRHLQGTAQDDVWPLLAKRLGTTVLVPTGEARGVQYLPTGAASEVMVEFPDEFGDDGPRVVL